MSKYAGLWEYVGANCGDSLTLPFAAIEKIAGAAVDHSFLNCKKELTAYGCRVKKISLKEQTVTFERERTDTPS